MFHLQGTSIVVDAKKLEELCLNQSNAAKLSSYVDSMREGFYATLKASDHRGRGEYILERYVWKCDLVLKELGVKKEELHALSKGEMLIIQRHKNYNSNMTTSGAETALKSKNPGDFILRYSVNSKSFVISFKDKDGGLHHLPIQQNQYGDIVIKKLKGGEFKGDSLDEAINQMQKENGVKVAEESKHEARFSEAQISAAVAYINKVADKSSDVRPSKEEDGRYFLVNHLEGTAKAYLMNLKGYADVNSSDIKMEGGKVAILLAPRYKDLRAGLEADPKAKVVLSSEEFLDLANRGAQLMQQEAPRPKSR